MMHGESARNATGFRGAGAEFVRCLEGEIEIEYLPAYAPELNPVEYLWGHWKHHELPNVCPKDLWQLSEGARRTLGRLRRRPRLIAAFPSIPPPPSPPAPKPAAPKEQSGPKPVSPTTVPSLRPTSIPDRSRN